MRGDVAAGLLALQPDLRLTLDPSPDSSATVLGVRGSPWLLAPFLLAYPLGSCQLVGGPEPWRATRWAWFWIHTAPGAPSPSCCCPARCQACRLRAEGPRGGRAGA